MIKKCDFKGCEKAGVCRAPRSRTPGDYYWFCKAHAAEYNKNWNYYAGMSDDEIEEDWERENFGISDKERKAADKNNAEYVEFLRDFLNGKSGFDGASAQRASGRAGHTGVISKPPASVSNALCIFDLPPTATWRDVGARYRALAKKYHPDTARDKKSATEEFARITAAYEELKKWLSPNISP